MTSESGRNHANRLCTSRAVLRLHLRRRLVHIVVDREIEAPAECPAERTALKDLAHVFAAFAPVAAALENQQSLLLTFSRGYGDNNRRDHRSTFERKRKT